MFQLFQQAGWVAWPLGLMSVLALAIVLERFYTLSRLRKLEERAFSVLQMALEKGDDAVVRDSELSAAPVTHVIKQVVKLRGSSEEMINQAAEISLQIQKQRLRKYLSTLASIGSTAPFIGLFGTVLGVMHAFHAMSTSGLSGEAMAAGISEALSATAVGLLVAIPAVIFYNFMLNKVGLFYLEIHNHVARLTPYLAARHSERVPAEV